MKRYIREFGYYLLAGLMFWYCWVILTEPIEINDGIIASLQRCLNVIIPSLFAVMVISSLLIRSSAYELLSKPFSLIAKYIFAMPKELFSVFVISNTAGYPVGAKLLRELYDKESITAESAEALLCCCYAPGPAFLSGTVGLAVYGSTRIGIIIFLSCLVSNCMIAAVICRIRKPHISKAAASKWVSPDMLIDSVLSCGRSLLEICLLIVFFSTVISVLEHYGIPGAAARIFGISGAESIFCSVAEISQISELENAPFAYIPALAAVCSFGGLCVVMQIITVVKKRFSLRFFLLTRPIASLLSALNSIWLCRLMLPDELAAVSNSSKIFVKVNNFIPSVCLILMIFLLKLKKGVAFSK